MRIGRVLRAPRSLAGDGSSDIPGARRCGHGRSGRCIRARPRPLPAARGHGPDRSPRPARPGASAGTGADRRRGPRGGLLPRPGRAGRRGRRAPDLGGAAPRGPGRPRRRQHRGVRRGDAGRGAGRAGGGPRGPRAARAADDGPAGGAGGAGRPAGPDRGGRPAGGRGARYPGLGAAGGPLPRRDGGGRARNGRGRAGRRAGRVRRTDRARRPGAVHRGDHRPGEDGPADARQRGRLGPRRVRHLRTGAGRRDGRGDAVLPRARAVRHAACHAGERGCVLLPARGRFSAHTFWDDMRAAGATWFTAVPTVHELLLERAATDLTGPQVPGLRFLRSSSAPSTRPPSGRSSAPWARRCCRRTA